MSSNVLYPANDAQVHRHSSIDQFTNFLTVYKKGGWAPLIFDQLDGVCCETIKTHPVAISFGGVGYVFPESHCVYDSDHFIYTDKEVVETKPLPECFGGKGDFYNASIKSNSFINFDNDASLGVHNTKTTRTGLDYCLASETLPPSD